MSIRSYYKGAVRGLGVGAKAVRDEVAPTGKLLGKLLEKTGFAATLATGVGLVQYLRGKWPFIANPENEYIITQYITEHAGPVLEGPGTNWYLYPLVKARKKNGRVETVSRKSQARDFKDLEFFTTDGYTGRAALQYVFKIPNKESAKRFYWGIGSDVTLIDEKVKGAITDHLNNHTWSEMATASGPDAWEPIITRLRYLVDEYGVEVTNVELLDFKPDKSSLDTLLITRDATERARATKIQSDATLEAAATYVAAAGKYKEVGSARETGDIALRLADLDNNQEVAAEGGTIVKMSGDDSIRNGGSNPTFVPLNLGNRGNKPRERKV